MDIKRTVLLVVFSLSLLMLWENWNRSNGGPSLLAPEQAAQTTAPQAQTDASVPQASTPPAATGSDVPAAAAPATAAGEKITITTDLLKVEVDTLGGDITRVELLKHLSELDTDKPVVLLEQSAARNYVAQSGLIGGKFPNHRSSFTVREGERSLGNNDRISRPRPTRSSAASMKSASATR